MTPVEDLHIVVGANYSKTFRYQKVVEESLDNYDLTSYRVFMQVRHSVGSRKVLVDLDDENNIAITSPTDGIITLDLSKPATLLFTNKCRVYDIMLVAPDGKHIHLVKGNITIERASTQETV